MSTSSLSVPLMRQHWSRLRAEVRSLQSLIVFACLTGVLFQSAELALIWTFSLGIHELAHVALIRWHGIRARIGFGILGAWTWSPLPEREALGHARNALIHLAGPCINIIVALLALLFQAINQRTDDHLLVLANFNALLALLNVLPFGGISDGAKVVKRILASLDEQGDRWIIQMTIYAGVITCLAGLIWLFLSIRANQVPFQSSALFAAMLWITIAIVVENRADNPAEAASPHAMMRSQALSLVLAMQVMVLISTLLVLSTPYFLTPDRTMHMLRGLTRLLRYAIVFLPMASIALVGHEIGRLVCAWLIRLPITAILLGSLRSPVLLHGRLAGLPFEIRNGLPILGVYVAPAVLLTSSHQQRLLFAAAGPLTNLLLAIITIASLQEPLHGIQVAFGGLSDLIYLLATLLLAPLGIGPFTGTLFESAWFPALAQATQLGISRTIGWWIICNICVGVVQMIPLLGCSGSTILMSLWYGHQQAIAINDLSHHWLRWKITLATLGRWVLTAALLYHLIRAFVFPW